MGHVVTLYGVSWSHYMGHVVTLYGVSWSQWEPGIKQDFHKMFNAKNYETQNSYVIHKIQRKSKTENK